MVYSYTRYTGTSASTRFEVPVESIQNHSELYQSIAYGKGFAPLV
jgi:hypothetical protein